MKMHNKNGIKVLYLSYDGLTDPLGQSQVLPYVIGLSKKGYSFTIISFEKQNRLEKERERIAQLCRQHEIDWVPLPYHKWPPVLSTLFDLYLLRLKTILYHRRNKYSIVHCRSYLTSLIGLCLKRNHGVKFIFDMRGFWADERVDGNIWNLKQPLYKMIYDFFKRKEKRFLSEADHIISLTSKAAEFITNNMKFSTRLTVIPTCVDVDLFDPLKITSKAKEKRGKQLGLKYNDFVILYLGSWGTWYMTEKMLSFFSEIKKRKPEAKLLIATPDHVDVEQFARKEDVIVTHVSRHEVPLIISLASCSLFFITPTFSKMASSATKLGELIAMGIPVITNSGVGDIDRLLEGYRSGYVIKDFTLSEYNKAIDFITEFSHQENFVSLRDYFSLSRGIELYYQVYHDLENQLS